MPIQTHPTTRIRVEEYHTMIADGRLSEDDRVELLDGQIVAKMTATPLHTMALVRLDRALQGLFGLSWVLRTQQPILLAESVPEPDLVIVPLPVERCEGRHAEPHEIELVVEVSLTTLDQDQGVKQALYAQAGLPIYWIINLVDFVVEVYTQPVQAPTPHYANIQRLQGDAMLPVILAGVEVGRICVRDLLPRR